MSIHFHNLISQKPISDSLFNSILKTDPGCLPNLARVSRLGQEACEAQLKSLWEQLKKNSSLGPLNISEKIVEIERNPQLNYFNLFKELNRAVGSLTNHRVPYFYPEQFTEEEKKIDEDLCRVWPNIQTFLIDDGGDLTDFPSQNAEEIRHFLAHPRVREICSIPIYWFSLRGLQLRILNREIIDVIPNLIRLDLSGNQLQTLPESLRQLAAFGHPLSF